MRNKNKSLNKISQKGFLFISLFILVFAIGLFAESLEKKDNSALVASFKKANKHYKKGLVNFSKDKTKKAGDNFRKCLDQFTDHAGAYFYLAKIAYKDGSLQEASTNVVKAKENYKIFVNMNKAVFQGTIKKYSENQSDLQKQSKYRDSGSFVSGGVKREAGKDGQKHFQKAKEGYLQYMDSVEVVLAEYHYLHGNINYKLKKFKECVEEFLRTIQLNPKHNLAYTNLASLYYMSKDYQKAREVIKQAEANGVAVNPKLKEALQGK